MGRNRIDIARIADNQKRSVTFNKRRVGLTKKAIELAVLCDCDVALVIMNNGTMFEYASNSDLDQILHARRNFAGPVEVIQNEQHAILQPSHPNLIRRAQNSPATYHQGPVSSFSRPTKRPRSSPDSHSISLTPELMPSPIMPPSLFPFMPANMQPVGALNDPFTPYNTGAIALNNDGSLYTQARATPSSCAAVDPDP